MVTTRHYWPVHILIFVVGLVISFTLLSGDALGRVNLLYLLLLYFAIPVFGALISLYSLLFDSKAHMAQWLARFGIMPLTRLPFFQELRKANVDRLWLLQQSQVMAVSFALSSILVLFVLLLFSDIAFVWRSTLLTPEHIYYLLSIIAAPWSFWSAAQPNLDLLMATQEFRLAESSVDYLQTGQWWLFILVTQCFYSIILRGLIYGVLQVKINKHVAEQPGQHETGKLDDRSQQAKVTLQAKNLSTVEDYSEVIIWDFIPKTVIDLLTTDMTAQVIINPWQGTAEHLQQLQSATKPLIVVKGYEPPMGELADCLTMTSGYILAINWQDTRAIALSEIQQQEWARFCQEHNWQLLLTGSSDSVD